jgi:hypothetical protein
MKKIIISFLLLFLILRIFGQAQITNNQEILEPLKIIKILGGITFDGIPDEAAWQSIPDLPMVMLVPVPGNEPNELSVIKLAYDDEYLYASGFLYFNDPKKLRAIGKKRDYDTRSTDWFGLTVDAFNDRENAVVFMTNPNGIRSDGTVKNDIMDEDADFNGSWNTFWDAKTNITDKGWSAEIRIPFSSLRFQTIGGKTLMGVIFMRWSPGIPEMSTFPAVSPKFNTVYWKPSQSRVVEFEGLHQRNQFISLPIYLQGWAR